MAANKCIAGPDSQRANRAKNEGVGVPFDVSFERAIDRSQRSRKRRGAGRKLKPIRAGKAGDAGEAAAAGKALGGREC